MTGTAHPDSEPPSLKILKTWLGELMAELICTASSSPALSRRWVWRPPEASHFQPETLDSLCDLWHLLRRLETVAGCPAL